MWIVQAVLVRSLILELGDDARGGHADPEISNALRSDGIGALAHSEEADNPFIFERFGERLVLKGSKKYITGGTHCDFILLTARRAGDSKVSSLIHLPASELPEGALEEISLPALRTTSHARLSLDEFTLHARHLLPLSGPKLRRGLRTWSIVERAFILRSYIALCVYMADRLPELCGGAMRAGLGELLSRQRVLAADQARQAAGEARVPEQSIDISRLFKLIAPLRAGLGTAGTEIPSRLLARAPDLGLFDLLKIGSR